MRKYKNPKTIFRKAADLLESGKIKWIKGANLQMKVSGGNLKYTNYLLFGDVCGACAVGILYLLTDYPLNFYDDVISKTLSYIKNDKLHQWNDKPHRRKKDVIKLFRKVADNL